ncbi:O-antigen ligase family protein [Candidatus Berkelbacteria bacterium]|nr:O-antigen ligase family protein [Candidatus Berkelbacteria bacterium]
MIITYILIGLAVAAITVLLAMAMSQDVFWGVLLLIFFLPFERIPTLQLGSFTAKINHLVGGLVIIFFLLDVVFNRRKLYGNPTVIPTVIFLLSLLVSIVHTTAGVRSIIFFGLDSFVIALFLIIPQLIDSREKLNRVVQVLLWSVVLVAVFGLYQFLGDLIGLSSAMTGLDPGYSKKVFGFPRIQAFAKEPLYLGNYLLIPLGTLFALFIAKIRHIQVVPIAFLVMVVFVLTLSRGAFLAFAVAAAIALLFAFKKIFTFRSILLGGAAVFLVLIAVNGILNKLGPDLKERFLAHATIQDYRSGDSTQGRLHAFAKAIDAFEESPVSGIGLGAYGMYVLNYPATPPPNGWFIVNNQYLELLAETGILGFASFVLLVAVILGRSLIAYIKTQDQFYAALVLGLTAAYIGTLVQYNFFSTLAIIHIWVLMGLIVAVQNLALKIIK